MAETWHSASYRKIVRHMGNIMDNNVVKAIVIVLAVIGAIALVGFFGMGAMMAGMMGRCAW